MAFTGAPVVKKISDRMFRITGVSLAGDASGTISFSDATIPGEAVLVAPEVKPYGDVTLQDAISVFVGFVTDVTAAVPVSVVKTGTDHSDFLITVHNDTAATTSASLEIYVEFH